MITDLHAHHFNTKIRQALINKTLTTNQGVMVRVLKDVTGVTDFDQLSKAAKILDGQHILSSQVHRQYRAGGITYDWVWAALNS